MKPILKLLLEGNSLDTAQMAQVLNLSEADVTRQLEELKRERVLLGFSPVLNLAQEDSGIVRAVIELGRALGLTVVGALGSAVCFTSPGLAWHLRH